MEAAAAAAYRLPTRVYKMLYTHQREGLRWLWSLHCMGTGGILGDDMGLGKTMQGCSIRFDQEALVVGPRTLLTHWIKELSIVGLSHMICNYYGSNKNIRDNELQHAFKEGGILLTTYDIVRINYNLIRGSEQGFNALSLKEITRMLAIGEGHRLKCSEDDKKLPKKNELIIWLKLTDCQVLKKICDHPLILTQRDAEDIFKCMDGVLNNHDTVMVEKMAMNLKDMAHGNDAVQLSQAVSCKLSFILSLLRNLLEEGHHVLIFSQTCTMLDMIQDIYELFSMPGQGFDASLTQKQLQEEHGQQLDMDESLREHIQFLEKQGIAGVSHHSLLFSETEILPMLSENDGPGRGAHGKPKDVCFTARTHLAGKNTDSDITEEINRLSETLGSTTPQCGDRTHELDNKKLAVVAESSSSKQVAC
ncbi:hypothetical protein ZWY2020_016715 [Hordeum vulgare]|nr:hypothetical protein ZWY2020_016715 [Hordeum vulgare]